MGNRAVLKQAIREVKEGQDRQKVFQAHLPEVSNPKHLATAIAGVPNPELKARYASINYVLVALLIVAALLKLAGGLFYFMQYGAFIGIAAVFLGILVPLVFAMGVARFEGQIYSILIILCIANALNLLIKINQSGLWAIPDLVLLAVIAGLSWWLKSKIFPSLGFLGAKQDANGAFAL
jgi:hypothetical protein